MFFHQAYLIPVCGRNLNLRCVSVGSGPSSGVTVDSSGNVSGRPARGSYGNSFCCNLESRKSTSSRNLAKSSAVGGFTSKSSDPCSIPGPTGTLEGSSISESYLDS